MNNKKEKILVTGGYGLLGSAMQRVFPVRQCIYFPTRMELDLLDKKKVLRYFETNRFDYVLHFAARVGGLKDNLVHPADLFTENLQINTNILEACVKTDVKKMLSVLSTCIYPDHEFVTYPLTEEQLYAGPPHPGSFGYAYAKRMMDVLCKAYRKQHGSNFINVIPNNMFGPNDNFHLENSHVVPAIIRKTWEAKLSNSPEVEIWGSGNSLREFTYSIDIAKICLLLLDVYNDETPLNIGFPQEYSIRCIAEKISEKLGYEGKLIYNTDKPDGQYRKPSSNAKFLEQTGWDNTQYTSFDTALEETCKWFIKTYPHVRGI